MNPTNKMTDSSFFRTQDLIRSKQGKYNAFVKKLDKQKETHEKPSWLSVIVNWFKKQLILSRRNNYCMQKLL